MRWIVLFTLLAIHFIGLLYFCVGFFPSKSMLPGFGQFSDMPDETNGAFDSQFDKVVIMVVDALRSDFMFSEDSSMSFVHSLINKGSAKGFTAFSNPPTVTLPRLKGITTGSTPNFLDAVLNVVEGDSSSTLASQDSWLKQLKLAGKKIHMYGDDTWLKLFPGLFDDAEGTSSFFVSDFTEVDNNVTKHLDRELNNQAWDCLILHYLGLDHIGHKGGPESVFMPDKQREMDGIIEKVYENIKRDTLFIVLGDHGMNEIGNHGGSSAGETSAALLFVSDKLQQLKATENAPLPTTKNFKYYEEVQQIDLVPTLASLLRLPIPKNSLGIIIRDFLPLWNSKDRNNVIVDNAKHLSNFEAFDITIDENALYETLKDIQSNLTRSATNYSLPRIHIGLTLIFFVVIFSSFITLQTAGYHAFFIGGFIMLFSVCSFGSSLIEEEHQIWWWFTTLFTSILSIAYKWSFLALISSERVIRGWNNSGQKFIGDSVSTHLKDNVFWTWSIVFITLSIYAFNLNVSGISHLSKLLSFMCSFMTAALIFTYKLIFSIANGDKIPNWLIRFVAIIINILGKRTPEDSLVDIAQMIFGILAITFVVRIILKLYFGISYWFYTDLHNIITLVLIMQTSIYNIGIFTVLFIIKNQFGNIAGQYKINRSVRFSYVTIFTIVLQNLTFFSFGQTNSLATVDLSNAYNGVASFKLLATGFLTFLANFSGPIYWSFGSLPIIYENKESLQKIKFEILKVRWAISLLFYSITTFTILGSCYLQRYHLFIWTVFSPKLLYTLVWNFLMNGLVEVFILLLVSLS